ncbi:MAG: DegV family protein [Oscillospiraceae bacterium]
MIELITDSTSDLSPALAAQLGVQVLPLTVHFGEESFRDGVDITNADFYARLRKAETLPTTSQINPETFTAVFQEVLDRGNQAVGIFISSELSGTCQSAQIARDLLGSEDVFVVDSRTVTFSLGLLVTEAARLRDRGLSASELAAEITALREKLRLYAVVDTLKYLKMGGRISTATAVVGGVLGITPIIAIEDGKVESVGKTRGHKAGIQWMRERALEEEIDLTHGVVFGHTDCPEALEAVADAFSDVAAQAPAVYRSDIGAVVGTHAGPGAAGFGYFVK